MHFWGDFHFLVLANDFSQRQAARYYWPSFFLICRFFICRWSRSVSGDLLLIPCKERWTGGDGRSRILTVVVLAISVSWSCSAMLLSMASWLEIDRGRCHHILHICYQTLHICYHTSHHSLYICCSMLSALGSRCHIEFGLLRGLRWQIQSSTCG